MEIKSTVGKYCPGICKIQKLEWEIKPRTEGNIGGVRNNALDRANGYTTIQNTTGSIMVPHQKVE